MKASILLGLSLPFLRAPGSHGADRAPGSASPMELWWWIIFSLLHSGGLCSLQKKKKANKTQTTEYWLKPTDNYLAFLN